MRDIDYLNKYQSKYLSVGGQPSLIHKTSNIKSITKRYKIAYKELCRGVDQTGGGEPPPKHLIVLVGAAQNWSIGESQSPQYLPDLGHQPSNCVIHIVDPMEGGYGVPSPDVVVKGLASQDLFNSLFRMTFQDYMTPLDTGQQTLAVVSPGESDKRQLHLPDLLKLNPGLYNKITVISYTDSVKPEDWLGAQRTLLKHVQLRINPIFIYMSGAGEGLHTTDICNILVPANQFDELNRLRQMVLEFKPDASDNIRVYNEAVALFYNIVDFTLIHGMCDRSHRYKGGDQVVFCTLLYQLLHGDTSLNTMRSTIQSTYREKVGIDNYATTAVKKRFKEIYKSRVYCTLLSKLVLDESQLPLLKMVE